jgi:hypothetical protein
MFIAELEFPEWQMSGDWMLLSEEGNFEVYRSAGEDTAFCVECGDRLVFVEWVPF